MLNNRLQDATSEAVRTLHFRSTQRYPVHDDHGLQWRSGGAVDSQYSWHPVDWPRISSRYIQQNKLVRAGSEFSDRYIPMYAAHGIK